MSEPTITVTPPKPWWMLHNERCPRFGKVTLDATVCSCDAATVKAINEAAAQARREPTDEEAALVRRVLATTGHTAPMHDRLEARRIVDRFLPALPQSRGDSREDEA